VLNFDHHIQTLFCTCTMNLCYLQFKNHIIES
jgi:hypothetical protein